MTSTPSSLPHTARTGRRLARRLPVGIPATLLAAPLAALLLGPLVRPAAAQGAAAATGAATGRIEGTVADSVRRLPLAGSTVSATLVGSEPETTVYGVTNEHGWFRIDGVAAGRWAMRFESALLDSLEYGGPAPEVAVRAGKTTRVALAIPSGETLRAAACAGVRLAPRTGALLGRVGDADSGRPLAGARVLVGWIGVVADSATRTVRSDDRLASVAVDENGQYRFCGLPTGEWLMLQVQHEGRAGAVLRASIGEKAGVLVRNLSFSAGAARPIIAAVPPAPLAGTAVLSGTVSGEAGLPLAGAEVRLVGTDSVSVANAEGEFTLRGLPAGTHDIEVRHLGHRPERLPVDLRSGRETQQAVVLVRVVALDSVMIFARRSRYPEFDLHRKFALDGTFLTEEMIDKLHATQVSQIVGVVPGFFIARGPGGGAMAYSARDGRGASTGCPVRIVVDNIHRRTITDINEVPASQVGAMELYPGPTGAPPQFRWVCGTIMIWTKKDR